MILNTGKLKCWGSNKDGLLGIEQTETEVSDILDKDLIGLETIKFSSELIPVQVAIGLEHSCALFNDATVRCWGKGSRKNFF